MNHQGRGDAINTAVRPNGEQAAEPIWRHTGPRPTPTAASSHNQRSIGHRAEQHARRHANTAQQALDYTLTVRYRY